MFLKDRKGIILIACYLVIIVLAILGGAFLVRSTGEKRAVERERDSIQAFYLAEAGVEREARDLYNNFSNYFYSLPAPGAGAYAWFNGLKGTIPYNNQSLSMGTYTVIIEDINVDTTPGAGQAEVTLNSTGRINITNTEKSIRVIIRYRHEPAGVFNYSYFVNNLGWFWGGGITANGDIRSNGNFSFNGNPAVNGDIYGSANPDLGASGDITGNSRNDTIDFYRNHADDEARPTNPTADPSPPEDYNYPNGYDGNSERFPNQEALKMPYLGNLQQYKDLALNEGGTISQGGVVLVNAVYEYEPGDDAIPGTADDVDVGPDGLGNTPDDGCIALIGTEEEPIIINGPVVIDGDVVLTGTVTGQGIIYSGRNTHIIGNLTYQNGPTWPKPDTDPTGTDAGNDAKDFLGLATRGNVVIGDYTRNDWKTTVRDYLKPPFTQAYDTDSADADIGYDTDGNPDNGYRFDGDYTAGDGGVKDNGSGGSASRRYYESSLSDDFIHDNATSSNQIRRINAVTYTNHAFAARVGDFTMNGSIIGRDEAIIYSGHITMNYDIRAKTKGDDFHLPTQLAFPQIISWQEN